METDLTSTLHQVLKVVKSPSANDISHESLMKINKDSLAKFVESLSKLMQGNIELCKSATGKLDEQIKNQSIVIENQREQISTVQETVKTEIKSWSDVVKKNSISNTDTVKSVKKAVKSVVDEDKRSKNFIVYGEPDSVTEDLDSKVNKILMDFSAPSSGIVSNE